MAEFVSVIEFEGPIEAVVWKSPIKNCNSTSQLIVDEGHWAVLLVEGNAELYGPGRHTLATSNIPLLRGIQAFATAGKSMYPCQVFFVKQVHSMDVKWGSKERLTVNDPQLDIIVRLMFHGSLTYAIDNPIKFVEKFCGFAPSFSPDDTVSKFRGILSTEVTDCIAKIVSIARIGYLDINTHLKEISMLLQEQMAPYFESYGIKLVYFLVETITSDVDDLAEVKKAKAEARARVIEATGEAQSRDIQGYSWIDERKADILQALASNQGSIGGMMGFGVGMMSAGSMGSNLNSVVNDVFSSDPSASPFQLGTQPTGGPQRFGFTSTENPDPITPIVTVQGTPHVDVRDMFSQSGAQGGQISQSLSFQQPGISTQAQPARHEPKLSFDEIREKLGNLQQLLELGLITQEDFEEQKKILLNRL